MKIPRKLPLISIVCLLSGNLAADVIPTVYGTGVDDFGDALVGPAVVDPHYQLIESAHEPAPGPEAVTLNPGWPVAEGVWLLDDDKSRWIAPNPDQNIGSAFGDYVYRLTFNLAGFDPNTARITGRWASDNGGMDIRINGESTFQATVGFNAWADFEVTEGFQAGENTLDFLVNNAGENVNPTGLRVEITEATADTAGGAPPVILNSPNDVRGIVGDAVLLGVTVGGTPPFTYQWKRDGVDIEGATSEELSLDPLSEEDAGSYLVTVSNAEGEASSDAAAVEVFLPIPGLYSTGVDDDGTVLEDASVDGHYVLTDNADGESTDAIVHDGSIWPIVEGPWLANSDTSKWIAPRVDTAEAAGGDYTYRLNVDLTGLDPSTAFVSGSWTSDNAGVDVLLNGASLGLTNSGGFGTFFAFGIETGSPFVSGMNTLDFVINNAGAGPTALRVDNMRGGAKASEAGPFPPTIAAQPVGTDRLIGEDLVLRVIADGTPPLTYDWKLNGTSVGDSSELDLSPAGPEHVGDYTVTVTNAQGSVTSESVSVVVLEPIPDLFDTGVGGDGLLLAGGEPDPHYTLTADPNDEGLEAVAVGSPPGAWIANTVGSQWIGVSDGSNGPAGDYAIQTTFDLSAFDVEHVFIEADWATDNLGTALILNGTPTGLTNGSFTSFSHFRLEEGFVPGINTLEFVINNAGDADNPFGLRIENFRGGGQTEDPNLIGPSTTPFGELAESKETTVTVPLRNSGRTEMLLITGSEITGPDADLFTLGDVPAEIATNTGVDVMITVDPKGATGNFSAMLKLTTNDPSTPDAEFDISAFIPVAPNLIAHYKLDETEGTRADDASGFGRHAVYDPGDGTLSQGADGIAGGGSAMFSEGAQVEVPGDLLPVFGEFTFSLWANIGQTTGASTLVSRGNGAGDPFALVAQGTALILFFAAQDAITVADAIALDTDHHIALTLTGQSAVIYVDGVQVAAMDVPAFVDSPSNLLHFGAADGNIGITGVLDDIQIYNRALTDAEVLSLKENPGSVIGGGDVEPEPDLPTLDIMLVDGQAELSWPDSAEGYGLNESGDLRNWSAVATAPEANGGFFRVQVPVEGEMYFRLEKQ